MRKLTLMAATAGFICSTTAFAAPIPSGSLAMDRADQGQIVQVKKKMKKKKMMNQSGMSGQGNMGQGGSMGQGGGMSQPGMGGSASPGQPMSSPSQKQ